MASEGESDMCWICLEEAAENGSHTLMNPCKCPRKVHPQCLARWQLQQAGRHEEKFCRFCNSELNDWKLHLTPEELKPEVNKVQPIMVVYFEGQIHRIPVKQGPDGLTEFTGKIRELFRLPEDVDISLTFGCKEPMSGTHLKLEGMGAFDAAVHCASVAAAERQQKIKKSYSTGNLGSTPALAAGSGAPSIGRSASNNSIPAANLSASAAATHTLPSAAGLSAANAAQDRRRRFQGEQGTAATGGQQQRGHAGRSRSFTVGTTPTGRATGVEPPAAFRNILNMLGGSNSSNSVSPSSSTPFAAPAAQGSLAPEQGADGAAAAAQAPSCGSSPAPAGVAPTGGVSAEQQRLKKGRLSLRNITELTDVPEIDETVAIGSFSGKFKLQLKAFSRKVVRSLSFTNKGVSARGEAASSGSAAAVAADGFGGFSSTSTSRAASMTSPRVIHYGAERAVTPSPRSITSNPLPPHSPSIVRAAS